MDCCGDSCVSDGLSQTEIMASAQRLIMHFLDQAEEGEESEEATQDPGGETDVAPECLQEPHSATDVLNTASADGAASCVTHSLQRRSACTPTSGSLGEPHVNLLSFLVSCHDAGTRLRMHDLQANLIKPPPRSNPLARSRWNNSPRDHKYGMGTQRFWTRGARYARIRARERTFRQGHASDYQPPGMCASTS